MEGEVGTHAQDIARDDASGVVVVQGSACFARVQERQVLVPGMKHRLYQGGPVTNLWRS